MALPGLQKRFGFSEDAAEIHEGRIAQMILVDVSSGRDSTGAFDLGYTDTSLFSFHSGGWLVKLRGRLHSLARNSLPCRVHSGQIRSSRNEGLSDVRTGARS